ncbi:LysR family transcriptional regulator [Streptomyces kanasensis]|uniref:LysR family transcriptional regulator n=1 Tax=Streptomyces kanasensis TaxID=936756 RepID=UPI0037FBD66F
MNVEVQDLRVLRAVADAGSLAGAARALGVSQAGLTRRIQHLERGTGLVVLRRDHRGARLTVAGRLLLRCADDLLPRIDHLLTAGGHGGPTGPMGPRLRIGTVPTPVFPLVCAHARELLPRVELELCTLLDADREPTADARAADAGTALLRLFRVHRLDLAVVRQSPLDEPLPDTLASAVLAEEDMLIGTAAGHRLAGRRPLALRDLDGEVSVLVGGRRGADLRHHFAAAVRDAEVHVEVRWASDETEATALACAVQGVLPAYWYPAPAAGVVYTPLTDPGTRHRLLLVWPPHSWAADRAPALADGVREAYRSGRAD